MDEGRRMSLANLPSGRRGGCSDRPAGCGFISIADRDRVCGHPPRGGYPFLLGEAELPLGCRVSDSGLNSARGLSVGV